MRDLNAVRAVADAERHARSALQAAEIATARANTAEEQTVAAEHAMMEANARAQAAEATMATVEAVALRVAEQAAEQAANDRAATFAEIREIIHERRAADQEGYLTRAKGQQELLALMKTNLDATRQCLSAVEGLRDTAVKANPKSPATAKARTAASRRATSSARPTSAARK
jgi:hypothetical protein